MNLTIEKVQSTDAQVLTDLTFRSKAYWNYSPEQMEAWRDELRITTEYLAESTAFKLFADEELVGYYAYRTVASGTVKLDNLFVEPAFIGRGFGNYLLNDFMMRVEGDGFKKVVLDADPNSEAFYLSYGFRTVSKLKTTIVGRFMPVMEKHLGDDPESLKRVEPQ